MDDICTTIPMEVITTHILPLRPSQWLSVSRHFYDKALALVAPTDKQAYIYHLVDYISRSDVHSASIFLSLVDRYPSHDGNIAFDCALKSKNEDLLQLFVKHPMFDASQKICGQYLPHETPLEALIRRHFNLTAKLMLQLGADASIEHNIALITAIESNNQEMFDIIIQDPRVDLSAPVDTEIGWEDPTTFKIYKRGTNEPIICASKKGNLQMVQQLLLDSRVDISVGDFKPFKEAARKGHVDILQYLAQHAVSEIALHGALDKACSNGHAHIVKWLFAAYQEDYERYDPDEIFQYVTEKNYPEIAALLLQNQYLKITYFGNSIEQWKKHGNQEIVDMIIQYKQSIKSAEKRKAAEELQGHPKKKQKSNDE